MSEEVIYADLKFQDASKIENIQEFDQVGTKAPPAIFHVWRQRALALALLCLLLLIGLGVLGSMFYITSKTEMEKLKKLQYFKEELQKNVSLQLMHNMNNSKNIMKLSITLQIIATKLCYELSRKKPEHQCNPCPKEWMWHGNSCYLLSKDFKTWPNSDKMCSANNASLLKIKDKSVAEFIKFQKLHDYWLGLSPRKYSLDYQTLEEIIMSSDRFTRNTNDPSDRIYCRNIRNAIYIYSDYCTKQKKYICEKLANPVRTESILMNEVPDGRM
ncbi:C-type lectin domain family 12 member A [Rhinolophus ferrumequinum]|uniref:C-type lectin domain family 12 member A n=1 Tax=Rhinolophus ferrumequinum TaxID=59479 RepID=A0A7J7WNT0_RHIFE|nr:C-type lectin domain family 12 member A [Rhinolophus ferrumequinum]